MEITVRKIGDGTEGNPFRPDTELKKWIVIKEEEFEFLIKVKN